MLVKHCFNEEFKTCNIGKRDQRKSTSLTLQNLKQKYNDPIPSNSKKLANLVQLLPFTVSAVKSLDLHHLSISEGSSMDS